MTSRKVVDVKSGKLGNSQRRDKNGSSKKCDAAGKQVIMTGWDLPLLPDDNDIVSWMKRETNGDNIKKPRRDEEVPEEQFRHLLTRCKNVEDQMEFERESLHERYRKHCQFGGKQPESRHRGPPIPRCAKAKVTSNEPEALERSLTFPRTCKSAEVPSTPKTNITKDNGLLDSDLEHFKSPPMPSRSHSVIDDNKLLQYGLTLPPDEKTARLLELAGKFIAKAEKTQKNIKEEPEDNHDEGYGSKGSNNDVEILEDDTDGSRVAHFDTASVYTNLESLSNDQIMEISEGERNNDGDDQSSWTDVGAKEGGERNGEPYDSSTGKLGGITEFQRYSTLVGSKPGNMGTDAIAKLMYSQRDRNVYERSSNRRARNTGFRYAGKEQSRLMETSLNNITPGYLSLHQFANLSNFSSLNFQSQTDLLEEQQQHLQEDEDLFQQQQPHNEHQQQEQQNQQQYQQQQQHQQQQRQQQQQQHQDDQPKPLLLRRICLQDANSPEASPPNTTTPNGSPYYKGNIGGGIGSNGSPVYSPYVTTTKNSKRIFANFRLMSRADSPIFNNSGVVHNGAVSDTSPAGVADLGRSLSETPENKNSQFKVHDFDSEAILPPGKLTVAAAPADPLTSSSKTIGIVKSDGVNRPRSGATSPPPAVFRYLHRDTSSSSNQQQETMGTSPSADTNRTSESSSQSADRLSTTCFPVGDLLPAVEKNIRRRKTHGLGRQTVLYRSHTTVLEPLAWRRPGGSVAPPTTSSCHDLHTASMASAVEDASRAHRSYRGGDREHQNIPLIVHKGHGPPGFRPHHSISPLQRAKEIANRRLHGHITTRPDGTEAVRVSSPQYQATRMERINSASRQLGRVVNGTWRQM